VASETATLVLLVAVDNIALPAWCRVVARALQVTIDHVIGIRERSAPVIKGLQVSADRIVAGREGADIILELEVATDVCVAYVHITAVLELNVALNPRIAGDGEAKGTFRLYVSVHDDAACRQHRTTTHKHIAIDGHIGERARRIALDRQVVINCFTADIARSTSVTDHAALVPVGLRGVARGKNEEERERQY